MPHFLIRFTTGEPDRVIKASSVKPESRDGFDVYVAYGSNRTPTHFFTGIHVLAVEETVVKRTTPGEAPEE